MHLPLQEQWLPFVLARRHQLSEIQLQVLAYQLQHLGDLQRVQIAERLYALQHACGQERRWPLLLPTVQDERQPHFCENRWRVKEERQVVVPKRFGSLPGTARSQKTAR